jgi:hypothetical protein
MNDICCWANKTLFARKLWTKPNQTMIGFLTWVVWAASYYYYYYYQSKEEERGYPSMAEDLTKSEPTPTTSAPSIGCLLFTHLWMNLNWVN